MPYCANCGNEISPAAAACPRCGHPTGTSAVAVAPESSRQVEGFAVASIACSAGGLFLLPVIAPILGIIFSFIAKRNIEQNGKEGRGMATAGLVVGIIALIINVVVIVAIALWAAHGNIERIRY